MSEDYARYLAAKRTVDDRALNKDVLAELRRLLTSAAPRVLEVGAGLGTMVARLLEGGLIDAGEYTLLDVDARLLDASREWLATWARAHERRFEPYPDGCLVGGLRVRLVRAELGEYLAGAGGEAADLLIANAVLDLVDVSSVLPALLRQLTPGGIYWFTINYDGETILLPEHPDDDRIIAAYHRDMDERVRYGRPAGDSRTGRRLFGQLHAAGAPPLAAGSSDWVVHPAPDGSYPHDEAFFLEIIVATIRDALAARPEWVAADVLTAWYSQRREQLARGELVYLAHQLDFVGRSPVR